MVNFSLVSSAIDHETSLFTQVEFSWKIEDILNHLNHSTVLESPNFTLADADWNIGIRHDKANADVYLIKTPSPSNLRIGAKMQLKNADDDKMICRELLVEFKRGQANAVIKSYPVEFLSKFLKSGPLIITCSVYLLDNGRTAATRTEVAEGAQSGKAVAKKTFRRRSSVLETETD